MSETELNMIRGYLKKGKNPIADLDLSWWTQEIQKGIDYRKKQAQEDRWKLWNQFYENDYDSVINLTGGILPVNLFFMMMRTFVPRIYFRNPSISVTPLKPGPESLGLSKIMERLDNKLIKQMKIKKQLKAMVQTTFLKGTSIGKLGYGSEFVQPAMGLSEGTIETKGGIRTEYRATIDPRMPWFLQVPTDTYVVPEGTIDRLATPWEVHVGFRPVDDIKRTEAYDEKARQLIGPTHRNSGTGDTVINSEHPDLAAIWEIHDRRTNLVFTLAPNAESNAQILLAPQLDSLQSMNGGPFYTMIFNPREDSFWGLSDSKILEPYQLEINDCMTQIMHHRRQAIRKLLANKDGMTQTQAQSLVDSAISSVVFVEDINSVKELQVVGIPPELFTWIDKIFEIVKFTMGFSRNQFGEFRQGSEAATATESNIVRQASEIRVDERRDMMADMLTDIVQDINTIVFDRWGEENIEPVIGPYGTPIFVKFSGEMLVKSSNEIKLDPDNSVPETKAAREQKAIQVSQLLLPLTEVPDPTTGKPSLDRQRVIRYLIHELHGTEYDDMIFGVPNIYDEAYVRNLQQGNQGATDTVTPEQLGQIFQQAQGQGVPSS